MKGDKDSIEWLPIQSFDPTIVWQKVLKGFCNPEDADRTIRRTNNNRHTSGPSSSSLLLVHHSEKLLDAEVLSPSSDELSLDSGIQLGDPEGEFKPCTTVVITTTTDPILNHNHQEKRSIDCRETMIKIQQPTQTSKTTTVWHILLIFASILIGLYFSHTTTMTQVSCDHSTLSVRHTLEPEAFSTPARAWRKVGKRIVLDVDVLVQN